METQPHPLFLFFFFFFLLIWVFTFIFEVSILDTSSAICTTKFIEFKCCKQLSPCKQSLCGIVPTCCSFKEAVPHAAAPVGYVARDTSGVGGSHPAAAIFSRPTVNNQRTHLPPVSSLIFLNFVSRSSGTPLTRPVLLPISIPTLVISV